MGTNRISGFYDDGQVPNLITDEPLPGGQLPGPYLELVDEPYGELIGRGILRMQLRVGEHYLDLTFRRALAQDMCRQLGRFAADKEMPWFGWTNARDGMDVVRAMCVAYDCEMRRRIAQHREAGGE